MALRGSIYIKKLAKLSMRNEIDTQDEDKLSSDSIFYASMYILYHHACIFVRKIFSFELMKYIMMNRITLQVMIFQYHFPYIISTFCVMNLTLY